MNIRHLALATVVVAALGVAAYLGLSETSAQSDARSPLAFTIGPAKPVILPYEPLVLEFALSNPTGEDAQLTGGIGRDTIKLSIRKPDGSVVTPSQLDVRLGPPPEGPVMMIKRTIKAGESKTWREAVEYRLGELFGEPGEYSIMATYANGGKPLTTEWAALFVEQPEGDDLPAYESLKSVRKHVPGIYNHAESSDRTKFLQRFPNSRYADYVRYFEGVALAGKDDERAKELLTTVGANEAFPLAESARAKRFEVEERQKAEAHRRRLRSQ